MSVPDGISLEATLAALSDTRFEVRCQALDLLAARGAAGLSLLSGLLPSLLPLLADEAWQVRSAGVRALASMGAGSSTVAQALVARALEDSHLWVRHAALEGLEARAYPPEWLGAPLREALADVGSAPHRLRALQAVRRLRLFSEPLLEALGGAVKDPDGEVRAAAVRTLGEARPSQPHWVRGVVVALRDEHPVVRETACEALARLAPLDDEAFSALVRTALDAEPQVRIACAKALGQLPAQAPGDTVHSLLRDADERVREAALVSLGGAAHYNLPPSLWLEYLEDPSAAVRQAAEVLLAEGLRAGADLEPSLVEALGERYSWRAHKSAALVLARLEVPRPGTLGALSGAMLELSGQATRDQIAHRTASIEHKVLPSLLEALRHRRVRTRLRAARALGFFVLDSEEAFARAVPVFGAALRDPSLRVRLAATEFLGRMERRALPVYPELLRRAYEHSPRLQWRAHQILHWLQRELPQSWRFYRTHGAPQPTSFFQQLVSKRLTAKLSTRQEESLLALCLNRERWHLKFCRQPPPVHRAPPSSLLEAATRAAEAAVAHGRSRRQRADPSAEARDREREFVWLLSRAHSLGLARVLNPPAT